MEKQALLLLIDFDDGLGDAAARGAAVHRLFFDVTVRLRFRHGEILNQRAFGAIH